MVAVIPFTLPAEYPLVGLGLVSTVFLNIYQQMLVVGARKEAKISAPTLYASHADAEANPVLKKYNCVQRAHQNTLENIPFILSMLGYFGLFHPRYATAFTVTWAFGRIFFTRGYATGVAKDRQNAGSRISYIGLIGLFFGSTYVAVTQALRILN